MSISDSVITQIAHLARIEVPNNPHHSASLQKDLNSIIAMVDEISKIDTKGIEPMAHPLDTSQRIRKDIVSEENERDTLLSLSSKTEAGLFLVPKVIE